MTTTDEQDVVDLLSTDHHEVLALIEQIPTADADQRRELADTVIAELMRHAVAEEMYVYPAIRDQLPDGAAKAKHDAEEHQELEHAMKAIEAADPDTPDFLTGVDRLRSVMLEHVGHEEGEQFPELRAALSHEQLVEMGAKVSTAMKIAPTRPHPLAPHSALFHKTVGPGVGLVDRLRDALTHRPNSL